MKKPYVICHMMSSVDGRTLSKQWGKVKGIPQYEITGKKHKADGWMCGRVTMERDFAGTWPLTLEKSTAATPTYFEVGPNVKKSQARKLKLISVKKLPDDVLWVRYKVR